MARCCDALILLAETDVAMTTLISSHVKDKNVFSLDTKFSSLEKSWYFIGVYLTEFQSCRILRYLLSFCLCLAVFASHCKACWRMTRAG